MRHSSPAKMIFSARLESLSWGRVMFAVATPLASVVAQPASIRFKTSTAFVEALIGRIRRRR